MLEWLKSKLEEKGFKVELNFDAEGRTTRYTFDLYAELQLLSELKISLGVIVFNEVVKLEDIMKVVGLEEEFPMIKFSIVPLKGIEVEAKNLASKYGIDVVALPKEFLEELQKAVFQGNQHLYFYVEPVTPLQQVLNKLLDKVKPSLFKRSREKVEKLALIYIPLVDVEIEMVTTDEVSGAVEIIEKRIVFDGLKGYIVKPRDNSIDVYRDYGSLEAIPLESLEVLRVLSEERVIELETLAGELGIEVNALKPVVELLASKGFVDIYGDVVEFKGLNPNMLFNLETFVENQGSTLTPGFPKTSGKGRRALEIKVSLAKVEEMFKNMNIKVKNIRIVYYPFYVAILVEEKNSETQEKILIYDAVTGNETENIPFIVSDPDLVDKIKREGLDIKETLQQ